MSKPSDSTPEWDQLHEKIIGLGEKSIRKSYYPELQRKIRELEHEVAERKQSEKELKRNYENRSLLNQLLKLSLEGVSAEELCRFAADKLFSLSWQEMIKGVSVFLLQEKTQKLAHIVCAGDCLCLGPPCDEIALGECLCGQAAASGEVLFASQVDDRHSLQAEQMLAHGHYVVPIMFSGDPLGVICLCLEPGHVHDQREEDFFVAVANTLAGIIQRTRLLEDKNRYEALLSQAQKIEAIGTLSGGIAHDFNNLLAPMLGYAELALRDLDEESRAAKHITEVLQAANRAKDLVRQILALSHKVDHRLNDLRPINLEPVVREVLSLVRASIPTTVEIVQALNSSGCSVLVEPTHIHQVVLNLCTNAYHAMRDGGGTINVSLKQVSLGAEDLSLLATFSKPGDFLLLKVSDSGFGMDEETINRIFDPYFTTKKQGEGTGLGLAVVNGIIQSYGGYIDVYSEPGYGTAFNVYLPCCGDKAISAVQSVQVELPTGVEHILVVDDEVQVGEITCAGLHTLGYRTSLHQHVGDALDMFEKNPFDYDLVLTDMTMPRMTGVDLLKKIRRTRADIPIILYTGFSELIDEQKARQQGFQRYLMKPVVLHDLAVAVREVLDEKE